MDRRGGTSFLILLILNPIVILFYQNCSVLPTEAHNPQHAERHISGSSDPIPIENLCRLVSVTKSCAE